MSASRVIIVGLIILLLESVGGYIYLRYREEKSQDIKTVVATNLLQASASPTPKRATLTIQPETTEVKKGKIFKADLFLNTFSSKVTAADVVIRYDPAFLMPVATNSAKLFEESPILQKIVFNESNAKQGLATMSAIAENNRDFSGSGLLTSLNFKALKVGKTEITIVFTPGDTRDTNVVSKTEDILESATGLSVDILP